MATTAAGKGCFAETHRLALGVFGTFGIAAANACVAEADLVLVIGSKLVAERHGVGEPRPARPDAADVHADRHRAAQRVVELPRRARADRRRRDVLDSCATASGAQRRAPAGAERRVAALARASTATSTHRAYIADDQPILPQRVIGELQRNLPDDAIVTCDAGENRILMTHFYQTKRRAASCRRRARGRWASRIPRRSAAKLVHPDRPVVAVCGDGGFAMTMNGLMTAIEQDIPIITVVFNNKALGWVLHGGGPFAAEFNDFDHAAIARAMGCSGVRVDRPGGTGHRRCTRRSPRACRR